MLYPKQVPIDEKGLQTFIKSLNSSYEQILQEIKTATDFGIKRRKIILAQIDNILQKTGSKTTEYIAKTIPEYYAQGSAQATSQLKNIGADLTVSKGFAMVDAETIQSLVDTSQAPILEGITGISRSAKRLLGASVRDTITQNIAKGITGGDALQEIKKQVISTLATDGLSALTDRSGKQWSLETYAEMVIRTKAVEARNRGMVNQVAKYGYDLVQVSEHGGSCDACSEWEGEILSLSGDTEGYSTLQEAQDGGLFHPNCRHAINTIVPGLSDKLSAYE